jgi:hypothetical protein
VTDENEEIRGFILAFDSLGKLRGGRPLVRFSCFTGGSAGETESVCRVEAQNVYSYPRMESRNEEVTSH